MVEYEKGCAHRINHFMKVYSYARAISGMEALDNATRAVIEAAAVVHDIGIRPSLEKYGSGAGAHQQAEGPPLAKNMLERLGFGESLVERVCYLVSRHHTYHDIDGIDCQVLIEADLIVNIGEKDMEGVRAIRDGVFKTPAGIFFLDSLFADSR